ncbi:glycosyltransferase family protein [Clostridium sp. UBA1056]|uniref:glycosyltransferase family protein n=1 Tax=unclassified Clostridium TaxID=2614128 RepID=UPI003216EFB7
MKVVCIIQARVGSSRLPGKVLKNICGKTVLEHDVRRLKLVTNIDEIVIATTVEPQDDKIVEEAKRLGVKCFRGSENDVLSRYYHAAMESNSDIVVRVTSDCPCIDHTIIDNMVRLFKENKFDYINNTSERTFPRGYDVEVFTLQALEIAYKNATKDYEREHVTPYLYDCNNNFKCFTYKNNVDYSKYRITLDTEEDLKVIKEIYNELYKDEKYFLLEDVVNFLDSNPHIANINDDIEQKKLGE